MLSFFFDDAYSVAKAELEDCMDTIKWSADVLKKDGLQDHSADQESTREEHSRIDPVVQERERCIGGRAGSAGLAL